MSKKKFGINMYWGEGLAPTDCQYTIKAPHLPKQAFKNYVRDLKREGIYYDHDKQLQSVTMAFESKAQRDLHANMMEFQAKSNNYKIKTK